MNKKKKILLISYYFPPSSAVGAKRFFALRETLVASGYEVETICANWVGERVEGVQYAGKEIDDATMPRLAASRPRKKKIHPSEYFRSLDKTVFSSFVMFTLRYIVRNHGRIKRDYACIVVTYKPSASIILGIIASRMANLPLIIELRDLISIFGRKKKAFLVDALDRFFDKIQIRFANALVVVSPTAKKYAEEFYSRKAHLILNGVDLVELSPDIRGVSNRDYINVFYAGTLYDDRRLERISSLIHTHPNSHQFRLLVASKQDPLMYGADPKFTTWLGYLDRKQVYAIQNDSDFLLMLEGSGENSVENIPAKLFEYLGAGRPILADCNPRSDIANILKQTGRGMCVITPDDFAVAVQKKWEFTPLQIAPYLRTTQNALYLELIKNCMNNTLSKHR